MNKFLFLLPILGCATIRPHIQNDELLTFDGEQCKSELPVAILFDANFPEEWRNIVIDSANYWNTTFDKEFFIISPYTRSFGTAVFITFKNENKKDEGHIWSRDIATTAFPKPINGFIPYADVTFYSGWISILKNRAERESTARHELGHVLGLDHTPDMDCLLYPFVLPTDTPLTVCIRERELINKLYP